MRSWNTEYFGPIRSDTWRGGIGFIESDMSKPIEYLAPDCKVLLAFSCPHVDPYIQSYWSVSVSPSAFWATWISPVSSGMELALSNVWGWCGAWGKLLGCWKVNVGLRVSPEWGCVHLMQKANFRLLTQQLVTF